MASTEEHLPRRRPRANRIVALTAATASVVSLLVGQGTAYAAAQVVQLSSKGDGAEAFWATCPKDPTPAPGTVCTNTFMEAAATLSVRSGQAGTDLFVDSTTEQVDSTGTWQFVSDISGEGPATIIVDQRLSGASVTATLELTNCDPNTCGPAFSTDISASWTGTGTAMRSTGMQRITSPGYLEIDRFSGVSRPATATGTLGGAGLGTAQDADIFTNSSRTVQISH